MIFLKYSVDRIEENFAVCEDEDGKFINIQLSDLPEGVREGDLISLENSVAVILKDETEARRKKLAALRKEILAKKGKRVD